MSKLQHQDQLHPPELSDCIKRVADFNTPGQQNKTRNPAPDIRVAVSAGTMQEVVLLRKREYCTIYPEVDLDNDVLDQQAITLFTRDADGNVNSTARLSVDGQYKLPQHRFLEEYHARNARLMEWGRFIISGGNTPLLRRYYEAVYTLASRLGFDAIVMSMRPNHIPMHKRLIGPRIVSADMGIDYGGSCNVACVVWELESTKPEFFKWIWR